MKGCDKYSVEIFLYLEKSLSGRELEQFEAHLKECAQCRAQLAEERVLSTALKQARPLYSAPDSLRERLAGLAARHAPESRSGGIIQLLRLPEIANEFRGLGQYAFTWKAAAAILLVFTLGLIFLPDALQRTRAASYVETAVTTHRSYLNGDLPLQFVSSSPSAVTSWVTDRTAFPFRLPMAEGGAAGQALYKLTGARLISYHGRDIALVVYETPKEKISLLVASNQSAPVAGGEEVRSGNLVFHYYTNESYNVISWTNHGLTYALVSSLSGSARHSCVVCHASVPDAPSQNPHP